MSTEDCIFQVSTDSWKKKKFRINLVSAVWFAAARKSHWKHFMVQLMQAKDSYYLVKASWNNIFFLNPQ